jgi:ribosomal protein S12 methylthiotransferase
MAKVYFVSLGCDKNLVDTEVMLALLAESGHTITDDENEADVIVVNTCAFIHDAKQESIDTILEMADLKKNGHLKGIVATGCLAERYSSEIRIDLPEVDVIVGAASYEKIALAVDDVLKSKKTEYLLDKDTPATVHGKRFLSKLGFSAGLKIAEGCSKRCTYCAIPYIRGNYRSVKMEDVVSEAKVLAEKGIKELVLVAQETTCYGIDIYGKKMLPELLRELSQIDGIEWIRILYCYPEEITDELIKEMATNPKVCHYLDMPVQHASDRILRAMGRRTTRSEITERIAALRKAIPDIVLRTTVMVGFPGETDEDFKDLYNFIDETEFDRLGAFAYSPEEGTPAYLMEGQVDEDVKASRLDEIMILAQEISEEKNEAKIDKEYEVLIEGTLPEGDEEDPDITVYVGRTYGDAPDVDGFFFVKSYAKHITGDKIRAVVTDVTEYDLYGNEIIC